MAILSAIAFKQHFKALVSAPVPEMQVAKRITSLKLDTWIWVGLLYTLTAKCPTIHGGNNIFSNCSVIN